MKPRVIADSDGEVDFGDASSEKDGPPIKSSGIAATTKTALPNQYSSNLLTASDNEIPIQNIENKHKEATPLQLAQYEDSFDDGTTNPDNDLYAIPAYKTEHPRPRLKIVQHASPRNLASEMRLRNIPATQAASVRISAEEESLLTHITETPLEYFKQPVVSETSSAWAESAITEERYSKRREQDGRSIIFPSQTDNDEVDFVPTPLDFDNSEPIPNRVTGTSFVIQTAPMTLSQMMQYETVHPSTNMEKEYALPSLVDIENELHRASSGQVSTVAVPTPSRYKQLPSSSYLDVDMLAAHAHDSSHHAPSRIKTKIILKKSNKALGLATPVTIAPVSSSDDIPINSSPDVISVPKATHMDSLARKCMSVKNQKDRKKKRSFIPKEELHVGTSYEEHSDHRPAKRKSISLNLKQEMKDTEVLDHISDSNIDGSEAVESVRILQKPQNARERKKREPPSDSLTKLEVAEDTEDGEKRISEPPVLKASKRRGRPKKSGTITQSTQPASPSSQFLAPPKDSVGLSAGISGEIDADVTHSVDYIQDEWPRSLDKIHDQVCVEPDAALQELSSNASREEEQTVAKTTQSLPPAIPPELKTAAGITLNKEFREKEKMKDQQPINKSTQTRYRVGLSKYAKIQPLLKCIRK